MGLELGRFSREPRALFNLEKKKREKEKRERKKKKKNQKEKERKGEEKERKKKVLHLTSSSRKKEEDVRCNFLKKRKTKGKREKRFSTTLMKA